jgi:hypothetical protein
MNDATRRLLKIEQQDVNQITNRKPAKYPHLSTNFLKGSLAGQIRSLHRDKGTKPDKLAEFQQALKNRDIPTQGVQLTPQVRAKAGELSITLRGNTAKP